MKNLIKVTLFLLCLSLSGSFAVAQDRLEAINKDIELAKALVAERDAAKTTPREKKEKPKKAIRQFRGEVNEGTVFEGVEMPARLFNNIPRSR